MMRPKGEKKIFVNFKVNRGQTFKLQYSAEVNP